jgi:hypothetical protein
VKIPPGAVNKIFEFSSQCRLPCDGCPVEFPDCRLLVSHYNKALVINANYVEAHNNLGTPFVQIGRVSEALAHFRT